MIDPLYGLAAFQDNIVFYFLFSVTVFQCRTRKRSLNLRAFQGCESAYAKMCLCCVHMTGLFLYIHLEEKENSG